MSEEYKAISDIKYLKIIVGGYDTDGIFQEMLINVPQPCSTEISFDKKSINSTPSFHSFNYQKHTFCLETQYVTTADVIIKPHYKPHYSEEECKYYE